MFEDAKADLQRYRGLRKQRLEEAFWSTVSNNVKADSGNVDIKNKRITLPSGSLQNKDLLWNEYVKAAEAKGIHPSYTQFSENYAMAKDFDNQKIEKIKTQISEIQSKAAWVWFHSDDMTRISIIENTCKMYSITPLPGDIAVSYTHLTLPTTPYV